ncbi:hypothetical protein HKX48_003067 [Thoreauomyces humboldtii]|nr:hypothetical protein HKX48_003067 [Thoreauomyces humboldtii]
MHGTVPIKFRNITYNIPVALWVPHGYPAQPPICFVTPTSTMLVRASKHVDLSGKVYHPYLAYWHMNTEESSLLHFVRVLQEVFAQEPPVYTKPSNAAPGPQPVTGNSSNYQSPGYNGNNQSPAHSQPYSNPSGRLQQPQPHPQSQSPHQQQYGSGQQPPPQYQSQPVQQHLAMPDPRRHNTPPPPSQSNQPPPVPPPPPSYSAGRVTSNSPLPPSQQQQQQQQQAQPKHQSHHQPPLQSTQPPPPIPHKPLAASLDGGSSSGGQYAPPPPIDERQARLLAMREALKSRLRQKERELNATLPPDIERLLNTNKRLSDGENYISTALQDAENHQKEIQQTIESVERQTEQTAAQIETLRAQPDTDLDKVVTAPTVVHNQLLDLVAEDHAIDDTLYYLGKALDAEKISGSIYMKAVRSLAREQFIKRALIEKVRLHVGLSS